MIRNFTLSNRYFSESALLLVTLLWGGTFTIVKISLLDISPMLFIALRFSVATLILLPVILINRSVFDSGSVKAGLILGIIIFLAFAAQTIGLKFTTATKSGFITGSLVVMVPIFQIIIERKKPTKSAIWGVIIVFIGILFLSSGGNSIINFLSNLGANFNIGDFLTLICAALFAVHVVYLDSFSPKYDFLVLLFLQIAVAAVLGFISSFLFSVNSLDTIKIEYSSYLLFGILYTAVFASLITTALQTKYQKNVSPTKAGIIYSFEPIFAAIIAFFVLNEKITNLGFIGCMLIFIGLVISEVYDSYFCKNGKKKSQS
ncbi:DMT family transporter [Bacteroidota bacterium]